MEDRIVLNSNDNGNGYPRKKGALRETGAGQSGWKGEWA